MTSVPSAKQIDIIAVGDDLPTGGGKYNAHWHDYDAITLTNRTGATTAAGDVAVFDSSNDSSAILGDTVSSVRTIVVAAAAITNGASGEFVRSGVFSVKSTGAIARGDFVRKSATTLCVETTSIAQATSTGVIPPSGTVGVALAAASGGFVTMYLYGFTWTNGLLAKSASDVTVNGTTAETALANISVPANTLGTDRAVRVKMVGNMQGSSGSAQTCTLRVRFGASGVVGTTMCTHTIPIAAGTDLSVSGWTLDVMLAADGATNAQIAVSCFFGLEANVGSNPQHTPIQQTGTAAQDGTTNRFINITAELSTSAAGNQCVMQYYYAKVDGA